MPINSFLLGPLRQAPKVGHAYRKQVVEAIRVCHDLTVKNEQPESPREYVSLVSDFTLPLTLRRAIDLLEKLIEAAVKPRTTSNHTTDDIFVSFSEKLKNTQSCSKGTQPTAPKVGRDSIILLAQNGKGTGEGQ